MFEIVDTAGVRHVVYQVNGAYFLIFDEAIGWTYIPMDECTPVKEKTT